MREKGKWLGKLIQFEILYRVCLYLFVNPLLSQLLRLYLSRARSGMTFNSDIVMRFLSLPGIFLALFYIDIFQQIYYDLQCWPWIISIRGQESK